MLTLLAMSAVSLMVPQSPQRHSPADQRPPAAAMTRRQSLVDLGLACYAANWLLPPPLAHAGEVESVFDLVEWDETAPFTREDFRRLDESDDARFYDEPKLVYHIDDAAVASTTAFYSKLFASLCQTGDGSSCSLSVLDLCSSWVSHYPPKDAGGPQLSRVEGLGMNVDELKANPVLTGFTVRDLNQRPTLPYADASFDAITCTVSIDYLVKPLDVMAEAARTLKPGGKLALVFSNRLFFSKAVALWTGKDDLEHVYTVGAYMHYGAPGLLSAPEAFDLTPPRSRRGAKLKGDPLYAVVATKLEAK